MVRSEIIARINAAKARVEELIRQRDQINMEVVRLQSEIKSLTTLVWRDMLVQSEEQRELVGVTEAVRSVMRLHNQPMTAGQVKSAMDAMGYDFGGMSNASSVVHNTLKRLAGSGEFKYDEEAKTYTVNRFWDQLFRL